MPAFPPDNPARILIIKPSALGDVVHALPIASLAKRRWPEARLAWLVSRPFAPLLETNPDVDDVLAFDRQRGGGLWRHSKGARELAADLCQRGFDLVIDLQGLLRSGWLAWQTSAPIRVGFGYAREWAPLFYTHRVPSRGLERHAIERYLDLAELLGLGRAPLQFPLATTPDDEAAVETLLAPLNGEGFALLLPGTNWPTKRWPAQRFSDLARGVESELKLHVVIGGGADAQAAAGIIRQAQPAALDVTNATTIRQLVALIRRASLVVSNDSGPMHLAAALERPLVSMFGPTSPRRTGPFGRGGSVVRLDIVCSPCFSRGCLHQSCLRQLEAEPVLERCRRELSHHAVAGSSSSAGIGATMWSLPTQ